MRLLLYVLTACGSSCPSLRPGSSAACVAFNRPECRDRETVGQPPSDAGRSQDAKPRHLPRPWARLCERLGRPARSEGLSRLSPGGESPGAARVREDHQGCGRASNQVPRPAAYKCHTPAGRRRACPRRFCPLGSLEGHHDTGDVRTRTAVPRQSRCCPPRRHSPRRWLAIR